MNIHDRELTAAWHHSTVPASVVTHDSLYDCSYSNDSSPSFCLLDHSGDDCPARLWVESKEESAREINGPRFMVTGAGEFPAVLYHGDDKTTAIETLFSL